MIRLHNISKIYLIGKEKFYALRSVDLEIRQGEFVVICGASGSGKSTLLNIMGCMDSSSEGAVFLGEDNVSTISDEMRARVRNEKVGFVLQDFALINDQTVLYNVMLPLLLSKQPYRTVRAKAKATLALVGLSGQEKKKVNQLSGGQCQRVAIARAIVNDPQIILADEPTGQLDSQTGIQIMNILKDLNEKGITIVVVTHDPKVAAYASRQILLSDGQVVKG